MTAAEKWRTIRQDLRAAALAEVRDIAETCRVMGQRHSKMGERVGEERAFERKAALDLLVALGEEAAALPTLEAALAQDPVEVAARVVADLDTLARMGVRDGLPLLTLQRVAVSKGAAEITLAAFTSLKDRGAR